MAWRSGLTLNIRPAVAIILICDWKGWGWYAGKNLTDALNRMTGVLRRKHWALATEQSHRGWLKRYCGFGVKLPAHLPSKQKLEHFLTALAKRNVAASIQNQAFNPILFSHERISVYWKPVSSH